MALITNIPSGDLKQLVARLGGRWSGTTAMCLCPAHADSTPSLSIRQGDRGILVTCHAGCDRDDVMREIARIAHIPNFDPQSIKPARTRSGNPHYAIWCDAVPIAGTLGERYVRQTRNIWGPVGDVRFHPRCPRGAGKAAKFEPALIVAMRKGERITAIQRIFLDPETANYTAKIVLGVSIGAVWTGGMTAETIALAEGFETAAAYTTLTDIPAWATMGAKRLHQLVLPTGVGHVILLPDNDPEGRCAAARAHAAYRAQGVGTSQEFPPGGHNDWARLLSR
jgi:Toprim domain